MHKSTEHQMFLFCQETFKATNVKVIRLKKSIVEANTKNKIIVLWSIRRSNSHQLTKILCHWSINIPQVSSKFSDCQGSENSHTDDLQTYFKISLLF